MPNGEATDEANQELLALPLDRGEPELTDNNLWRLPKPGDDADLSLNISYSEKTLYNDRLTFQSRGVRTVIDIPFQHARYEDGKWVEPKETRRPARLHYVIQKAFDCLEALQPGDSHPVEITLDAKRGRITVWDTWGVHSLQETRRMVDDATRLWRGGHLHTPPKVDAETHCHMANLGIKLRKDGLFGYHLRCAREGCDKDTNTCYAKLTPLSAIKDKLARRSMWSCSTACWLISPDMDSDSLIDRLSDEPVDGSSKWHDYLEVEDDDGRQHACGIALKRMHSENPTLFMEFVEWYKNGADFDGEPCSDAGEVSCEV